MSSYTFAGLPSNASVATLVTLLVSGWFLVAAGAILAEPPALERSVQRAYEHEVSHAPIAAEARFTIQVVARRLSAAMAVAL